MAHYFDAECLTAPHKITNEDKVIRLYYSMKLNGWQGDPLVAYWWENRVQLLNGTHRLEAAKMLGLRIPVRVFYYSVVRDCWGNLDAWKRLMKGETTPRDVENKTCLPDGK
jgi:hypothetical protein